MDNILEKIYSHYLNDDEFEKKKNNILSLNSIKILKNINKEQDENFYITNNYFIKINNKEITKKNLNNYTLTNNSLFLDNYPKEILINNLLKKELSENIININNYYFNEKSFILIMDNEGELFEDFFNKHLDNTKLLNSICDQLFFILAVLQEKFQFMHKNLKFNNIIIKKYKHENIKFILNNIEYKIKTYNYTPVLYNFYYSTLFKIYDQRFEIYNLKREVKREVKKEEVINFTDFILKHRTKILNNNYFISNYDIFYFIVSFKIYKPKIKLYKTDIINDYMSKNNITNLLKYSESYLSLYNFIINKNKIKDENLISENNEIDQETIDKYKNAIIINIKNGLGNKLMTIINIIDKYKNVPIYFLEQLSHHQSRSYYDKLKYIFPNLNNNEKYKLLSWKLFDSLSKYGIKETEYDEHEMYYTIPGLINLSDSTRELLKMNPDYNYLMDKYDFENGIFVHYRLGDKLQLNYDQLRRNKVCRHVLLTPEYFIDQIKKMLNEKKGKVYVMSDSLKISKCLLKDKIPNITFIEEKTAETFFIMTHCKRFIISESTMTVAAVYLNNNKPQVIAPNFLIDGLDNYKVKDNIYFNNKIVTFINDRKYLLDKKNMYDKIYKECYIKIDI